MSPKSLCSFPHTHPTNQTLSPVNSTHHIAQTLPSSCPLGHWLQSGPLPPIWCHGLCTKPSPAWNHSQSRVPRLQIRGSAVTCVSFHCWTGPPSRSSAQALPSGTQIWELEMGSGSQELTQLEHIHRGWGKLCPKGNKT